MPRRLIPLIALVSMLAAMPAQSADTYKISITTGSEGGLYQILGAITCSLVNKAKTSPPIRCDITASGGSVENIAALRAGKADFAIVQSDVLYDAYLGIGRFDRSAPLNELRVVFMAHLESLALMARSDSGIRHIVDLPGRRVSIGEPGSGSNLTMQALMASYGWNGASFSTLRTLGTAEQTEALCAGQLDAGVYLAGHPNDVVANAIKRCGLRLAPVTGPEVDVALRSAPFLYRGLIPADTYPGVPATPTLGVRAVLVTNADQPPEIVYQLVQAVMAANARVRKAHPALRDLSPAAMAPRDATVPPHPGAARYFRETLRPR
jgi:TRAP transporter TAXI family solute receptor